MSLQVTNRFGLSHLLGLILLFSFASAQAKPGTISIRSGEVRVLDITGVSQVALGDPDKVGYKTLDNGQIMLVGKKSGESSVHIWRNGGREVEYWVQVENRYISSDVHLAKTLTEGIADINVYSMDGRVVIEGRIDEEKKSVMDAVASLIPDAVFILTKRSFSKQPLVRVDAVILEIGSNDMTKLGIDWDDSISGPNWGFHKTFTAEHFKVYEEDERGANERIIESVPFGDRSFFQYFGITSNLLSTINILESNGKARILSAPKLTAVQGETASFHVGGSFPIPLINSVGATSVERENYGVILEVRPTVENDDINLEVKVELSDIDPSVVVNGVPGTLNRSAETTVQLQHNQTVAVAGLFSASSSNGNSGLPGLSRIPVLKYLFGVQESDIEDSQVVILLTPKIITPGNEDDRALSTFGKEMMNEYQSKLTVDSALLE